jgi:hypothetical protein
MRATAPIVTCALVLANLAGYACERVAVAGGGNPCRSYGLVLARFVQTAGTSM